MKTLFALAFPRPFIHSSDIFQIFRSNDKLETEGVALLTLVYCTVFAQTPLNMSVMYSNYVVSDLLRSLTSAETATMASPCLLTLSFYSLHQGEGIGLLE